MSSFTDLLAQKAKAVATACGAILQTALLAVIADPSTEAAIVKIIPLHYQVVASLILGAIITAVVHQVPNAQPVTPVVEEPPTATTMTKLAAINGGEFTGPPAH
jgi:hypothetical protein